LRGPLQGQTIALVIRAIAFLVLFCSGCLFWEPVVSERAACLNLCDCLEMTPNAEEECVNECTDELAVDPVAQECLDCVGRASCEEFEDLDTLCAVECGAVAPRIVEEIE